MTHVESWSEAVHGLLAALEGRRAGRRVVAVGVLELVVDDAGGVSVIVQHGTASGFAAAPGAVLREFAAALVRAAQAQEAEVQ